MRWLIPFTILFTSCASTGGDVVQDSTDIVRVPTEWLRAADVAMADFNSRHENTDCYDVLFRLDERDHLRVTFSPPSTITTTGDEIILERANCGSPGETYEFDEGFELVRHWYVRH